MIERRSWARSSKREVAGRGESLVRSEREKVEEKGSINRLRRDLGPCRNRGT